MAKRLSLSKKNRELATGAELFELCKAITADGVISKEEIAALAKWLRANESDEIPAIRYLSEVVTRIIADKVVTRDELAELHAAIEKVLPPDDRRLAVEARKILEKERAVKKAKANEVPPESYCPYCKSPIAKKPRRAADCKQCGKRFRVLDGDLLTSEVYELRIEAIELRNRGGRLDAPTPAQLAFMIQIGISVPHGCTLNRASLLLDTADIENPPTTEERNEWIRLRDEIERRFESGENVESLINNPPLARFTEKEGSSRTDGAGCTSAMLVSIALVVFTCLAC